MPALKAKSLAGWVMKIEFDDSGRAIASYSGVSGSLKYLSSA